MQRILLLIAMAAGLSGCAQWAEFVEPEVTLVDLQLEDATLFETAARATVRIDNENTEPMVVEGGSYTLDIEGHRVGKGLSSTRFEIAPYSSATDVVDFHFRNVQLALRLRQLVETARLDYTLQGRVRVEMPYGGRRVSAGGSGTLDLHELRPDRSRPRLDGLRGPPLSPGR